MLPTLAKCTIFITLAVIFMFSDSHICTLFFLKCFSLSTKRVHHRWIRKKGDWCLFLDAPSFPVIYCSNTQASVVAAVHLVMPALQRASRSKSWESARSGYVLKQPLAEHIDISNLSRVKVRDKTDERMFENDKLGHTSKSRCLAWIWLHLGARRATNRMRI